MRGRNNNQQHNRRNQNPLTRVYESNGPDVKIRGTANHVAEKYLQLARDAQSSGDPVSAENYFQHAEHYFRLIAAANEQFRQQNPNFQPPRPEGGGGNDQHFQQRSDEQFEEGEDDNQPFAPDQAFGTREPQPFIPPNAQPFVQRDTQTLSAARAARRTAAGIPPPAARAAARAGQCRCAAGLHHGRRAASASRRRRTARTATRTSPTASRCIAAAGVIAARAATCRAAASQGGDRPDDNG